MGSMKFRRPTRFLFSLIVTFTVLQISQCFVPYMLRTATSVPRIRVIPTFRLQQQATQIDLIKSNEGNEIGNGLLNTNSTEAFGAHKPTKSRVEYLGDIFPRAPSLKLSKEILESTVDDALKASRKSMGLLGEPVDCIEDEGEILATSVDSSSSMVARVATAMDDFKIANLRLSVFSNFNPESRKLFCERSCQLLSSRRRRGATCVTVTMEKSINQPKKITKTEAFSSKENGNIVGTAEVSFHEFSGTQLGHARPKDSILYVTEVAVDENHRRKGIAKLMMKAVDALANSREIETIYLHVDVTNLGAINLYERAGYEKLEPINPLFLEFTTKLNLHDGATKGRNHFLMAKDLREPTWFGNQEQQHTNNAISTRRALGIDVMSTV